MQESFTISTNQKQEIINITGKVSGAVKKSKVKSGICTIFTSHATAAIIINENADQCLCDDIINALNKLIPEHDDYAHDRIDNNAAAHIKAALLGPSEAIPINNNELLLGAWQAVALVELDGPRQRAVHVSVIEDKKIEDKN